MSFVASHCFLFSNYNLRKISWPFSHIMTGLFSSNTDCDKELSFKCIMPHSGVTFCYHLLIFTLDPFMSNFVMMLQVSFLFVHQQSTCVSQTFFNLIEFLNEILESWISSALTHSYRLYCFISSFVNPQFHIKASIKKGTQHRASIFPIFWVQQFTTNSIIIPLFPVPYNYFFFLFASLNIQKSD